MTEATDKSSIPYVGRFAPSPSGPLHFGSLIAALASYLDARHAGGQWLVRMEDLDPPREQAGAASAILRCLEAHQLLWDGEVLYQSRRHSAYLQALDKLSSRGLIYPCVCTRKALAASGGPYPGTCRHRAHQAEDDRAYALRLRTSELPLSEQHLKIEDNFVDLFLGKQTCVNPLGDFILRRKDGLFAYQLAVVVDDIYQGITHVIRGADLLDSTPAQRFLFNCLHSNAPAFGHIPLALNNQQQKLSKQHGAQGLSLENPSANICAALKFLNHLPNKSFEDASIQELLTWAIAHWDRNKVPKQNVVVDA